MHPSFNYLKMKTLNLKFFRYDKITKKEFFLYIKFGFVPVFFQKSFAVWQYINFLSLKCSNALRLKCSKIFIVIAIPVAKVSKKWIFWLLL